MAKPKLYFILFSNDSSSYIAKVRTASTLQSRDLHFWRLLQNLFWSFHPTSSLSLQAQGTWWRRELLGLDWIMSVAPGTRPGQDGSSGMNIRKESRLVLKSSTEHFISRISFGIMLKSLGPNTWKLSNLFLSLVKGTSQSLPLCSCNISCTPGSGLE